MAMTDPPHFTPPGPISVLPHYGTQLREMTGKYRARNPALIATLTLLDLIGSLHLKGGGQLPPDRPLRVLIANWAHLGDVVAILPLLQFLSNHPRIGQLGVLVGSWSRCVVKDLSFIDNIHFLDHFLLDRSTTSRAQKVWRYLKCQRQVVKEISNYRYDASIDLFCVVPSTHRLTWKAGIPVRIGFSSPGLGTYLTYSFSWPTNDEYVLNKQLPLLKPILGDQIPKTLQATYPDFVPSTSDRLIPNRKYVLMHIGIGDYRSWPLENWLQLGRALKERGRELVFTGGKGPEAEIAGEVADKLGAWCVAGKLSWDEFVTTVAHAAEVISVDTVTGHLAACFSIPSIILLSGRWGRKFFRPNNVNTITLTHPVGCAPCYRSTGCAIMACVRYISTEEVLSVFDKIAKP